MNSLKTLLGATLLAALAYGVYVGITKKPSETARSGAAGPKIELGTAIGDSPAQDASVAPPFDAGNAAPSAAAPAENPFDSELAAAPPADYTADEPPPPFVTDPNVEAATAERTLADELPVSSGDEPSFESVMVTIEAMLQRGQLAEAHLELSKFYGNTSLTPEENQRLVELLSQLAGTVIYSRESLLEPVYTTVAGDTLAQLAAAHNVPWQLLAKINGLAGPGALQPGQQLKLVKGPFQAYIDLEDRYLVLFLNGERYAGRFPVAFGQEVAPSEGDFHVLEKNERPSYYGQDRVYTPEDPLNPLGTRKLTLDRQLSIHGTNDPVSLDSEDPRGCIRMQQRDIEDVYDILTIGSQVSIRR